jgi:hypothetical protein
MPVVLNETLRNLSAGAAGASFVALTQLATRDCIDISQSIAIGCFSVTLPIFVAAVTIPKFHKLEDDSPWGNVVSHIIGWSGVIFLLGIAALLWSFGWYFAFVFVAISYACYYSVRLLP